MPRRLPDFVYGRRKQEVSPGDPPVGAERRRPVEEWDIVVPGTYPAYISYDHSWCAAVVGGG